MKISKVIAGITALTITMLSANANAVSAKSADECRMAPAHLSMQECENEAPAAPDAEVNAECEARRAEIEAEREAKRAEIEAEREARRAEIEAEREARRAEKDAECEARRAEMEAECEAKRAEKKNNKPAVTLPAVKPEAPAEPETPDKSEVAVKPETPDKPEADVKPEIPEKPEAGVKPEMPEKPEAGVKPEMPEKPEAGVKPERPVPGTITDCSKLDDLIDLAVDQISAATENLSDEQIISITSIAVPLIRQMDNDDIKALIKEVLSDGVIDSSDIITIKNALAENIAAETL